MTTAPPGDKIFRSHECQLLKEHADI